MGTLTASSPVPPGGRSDVVGTGFRKHTPSRLSLAGVLSQVFSTDSTGNFRLGSPGAPTVDGTYQLLLQQKVNGRYVTQASADVAVKTTIVPVPPDPNPIPIPSPTSLQAAIDGTSTGG